MKKRFPTPSRSCAVVFTTTLRRYIFCATFLQVALTGRYPAHCPAEFGLSSPPSGAAIVCLAAKDQFYTLA